MGFIDFMLPEKTLNELTNIFSPNNFKKNYGIILNYFIELSLNLLLQHGDIEINPGSKGKCSQYFSCHWNLQSLPTHN